MSLARVEAADKSRIGDDALIAALEMVEDGASLSTTEGIIVYANPAEERLFGYERGELTGQHVSVQNAYSPEANARIVSEVTAALQALGSWSGEWFNRRKDGSVFVTSSQIRALVWRGAVHWLCIQRPIAAQESERIALAAEAAQLGIWEWDVSSNTFVYSQRARAICGFEPDSEVTYADVVRVTHPEDFPRTSAQAQRALDPAIRERTPFEYRVLRCDGAVRWVRAYGYAVFSDHETEPKALKYVGTLEDITERVLARRADEEAARQISLALDFSADGGLEFSILPICAWRHRRSSIAFLGCRSKRRPASRRSKLFTRLGWPQSCSRAGRTRSQCKRHYSKPSTQSFAATAPNAGCRCAARCDTTPRARLSALSASSWTSLNAGAPSMPSARAIEGFAKRPIPRLRQFG